MEWKDGKLVEARFYSKKAGKAIVRYNGREEMIDMKGNEEYIFVDEIIIK
jgi:hypothetical protein